ncbi:MAG: Alpha-galactosidase [Clostridiales bacterium]|jgi:hypothetical protein|nr:Alpha-galactosidase [Clostridiales bacterium]
MSGINMKPEEYLQGKITITYEIDNEKKQKVFPAANFYRDEDFVFYVFYEGEMALCIRQCFIEPLDNKVLKMRYFKYEKPFKYYDRTVLSNGFTSSSECREYYYTDRMDYFSPILINKKEKYCGDYKLYKHDNLKGSIYSHQFIGIGMNKIIDEDRYHIIAALDINTSYNMLKTIASKDLLAFHTDLYGREIKERTKVLNLLTIINTEKNCFDKYFEELDINRSMPKPIVAWDYTDCRGKRATPEYIIENINIMKQEKLDVQMIIINTGYENAIGDWLNLAPAFKNKIKNLIDEIHKAGKKVAIKIDPLICEKESIIYTHHNHWILLNKKEKQIVINTPKYGKKNLYVLNIYNEEVIEHLRHVFDVMVNQWGVDAFKIGTLFVGAIMPHINISRAATMTNTMKLLNELTQGREIIADEVPISIAINNCDYCCVTPKVSRYWLGEAFNRIGLKEKGSTISAIRTLILRRMYNNRGFLSATYLCNLSRKHNELTEPQRYTMLQVANILGGLLSISESINTIPKEELKLLKSLFPKKVYNVIAAKEYERDVFVCHFFLGKNEYYMIVNCTDKEKKVELPCSGLFCKETERIYNEHRGIVILPYSTKTLRKIDEQDIVIGSTGYVVPCGEIQNIIVEETVTGNNTIRITTENEYINCGSYFLKPNFAFELYVNDKKCRMTNFDGQTEKYVYEID